MTQNFLGKRYILKRSENFDGYMKELGVGLILRKMGNSVVSQCVLSENDDDTYTFTVETPYRCSTTTFNLDTKFQEVTLDNRVVTTVCHLRGNIFVQKQSRRGLKSTEIVREYKDNELITTLIVGDVKAVRTYGLLEENSAD